VFTVLLLDGDPGAVEIEGATVRVLEELSVPDAGLLIAGNPREAAGLAVLPFLMRSLLGSGAASVVYLDPGLRVLGALAEIEAIQAQHEVVLVARGDSARPADGPAYSGHRGGGALSRRILAIRDGEDARLLLDSWPRWFLDTGAAVDSWFDSVPLLVERAGVLRDPRYGLDPYTLHDGDARDNPDALEVAAGTVQLFDFSRLDPLHPDGMFEDEDSVALSEVPALAQLCERHALELRAAGYDDDIRRPDRLHDLGEGASLTDTLRKLLRDGAESGELSSSPFTADGKLEFFSYLNEPAERGRSVGLTHLHEVIWNSRLDLQAAYPHLDGPDGEGFAGWLCVHGPAQHGLGASLLPPAPAHQHEDSGAGDREPLWGVNVAGFFTSELGLGEAARLLIAGLDACGVPALPVQAELVPPCRQGAEFTYADPEASPYPVSIVCMNGDTIPPFAREVGRSFFDGRYTIALWWWEVGEFPEGWEEAFEHIDEVWVASKHIYDAIAPASPVPVVQVGLPVITPRVATRTRAELGLPEDGFIFLFVFDYHSAAARKNPVGLIEAFKRAFEPGSGAKLVLKSINAPNLRHQHDRVVRAAGDHPDITLIDAYVSAGEKNAMIAACDCYVSLHRSEGFGLTVAEAMLLAKPVIATRYGGTLEFTNDSNAYLVDWKPTEVGEGAHPYPPHGIWADPDIDQAAQLMRQVLADPDGASEHGRMARADVLEHHSLQVTGESMRARLRVIYDRRVAEGERLPNPAHMPALDLGALPALLASEPPIRALGPAAPLKRSLRSWVAKLMAPFRHHQRLIDQAVLDAIARQDERIQAMTRTLQDKQEARFAEGLALTRKLRGDLGDTRAELAGAQRQLLQLEAAPRLMALESLGRELEQHLAEHRSRPYVSEELALESWTQPGLGPVLGYRHSSSGADGARVYIDFEAAFRGPEQRVRGTQLAYLPLLVGHAPVLDVGCGRGELLDILREQGIAGSGVDTDAEMAAHSRGKGHDVALADANEHLRSLDERSLGAITALEVVEHLPHRMLLEFLSLARSRLREGGVLVFETVNPHAVHAMKAFWVDLTHQHPIFPEVAVELCRLSGFTEACWFHPTGTVSFEADRNSQPVYAVAARISAEQD
jgi:glycosyltransferase involved in cell wall biosynthesis/SAM-dependent methyltransferase